MSFPYTGSSDGVTHGPTPCDVSFCLHKLGESVWIRAQGKPEIREIDDNMTAEEYRRWELFNLAVSATVAYIYADTELRSKQREAT